MGVGKAGARNAGHLAARILALSSPELSARLQEHRKKMAEAVAATENEAR